MEFFSAPWPWYIAGPLIGLTVPLTLLLINKPFGISGTLRDICAMGFSKTNIKIFQYDWKKQPLNLLFVVGLVIGSFLVANLFPNNEIVDISEGTVLKLKSLGIEDFSGMIPIEIFSWKSLSSPITLILLCLGSFLVGFGARYAGGCTSGHAIMGLSLFSLSSLIAVIGFFCGGLLMTWFVFPYLFKLL